MSTSPNLYGQGKTSDDAMREQGQTAATEKEKMGEGKPVQDPLVSRYWREIERYERAVNDWYQEGDQIVDVYLDGHMAYVNSKDGVRKFPLLWANVEVLKPAIYAKIPTLMCSRRFKDRDPVGRVVAEMLERATNTTLDLSKVDETFRMVRDDRLLPGRGQAWVRYEATIETTEEKKEDVDADSGETKIEVKTHEKLKDERVVVDHVGWKEFGHNVGGKWSDVWLVWRIVYKSKDEVADRFGDQVAEELTYSEKAPASASGMGSAKDDPDDRVKVYELWDKKRNTASWMTKGQQTFLDTGEPPIKFRDFFPCPEPCYATKLSKELIPRPDYRYYKDQAKEINDLTDKIGRLTEWLIVKGFVPGGPSTVADPIEEVIRDKQNTELFVQLDSYQEWKEKGGTSGLIDWFPIDIVIKALEAAINARNQLIQDVFQITGVSDVMRAQTDPNETLGAQELKAQTGGARLRNARDEIGRFTGDIGRLVAEVIATKFEPKSIAAITGYTYQPMQPAMPMLGAPSVLPAAAQPAQVQPPVMGGPQPAAMVGQSQPGAAAALPAPVTPLVPAMLAMLGHNGGPPLGENDPELVFDERHIQLMRNDQMRNFRVDIEPDSTTQADENAEKQAANEFVETIGQTLTGVGPVLAQAPTLVQPIAETILFLVRRYRAGRSVEEAWENGFQKLEQQLMKQLQNPPPNPAVIKVQAEATARQQELQAETQSKQAEIAAETQANIRETIVDAGIKQQAHQANAALAASQQHQDAILEVRKQNLDAAIKTHQIRQTANAQAQDRIAKAMASRPVGGIQ